MNEAMYGLGFPTSLQELGTPFAGFNGYAADGVATVKGLDGAGNVLVAVPVTSNLFAAPAGDYTQVAGVEAFDARGDRIWRWQVPRR